MKKTIIILLFTLFSSFNFWASIPITNTIQQTDKVTATINKETTDAQFKDLKKYFKEHDITIEVKKVSRNASNEITGLNLSIQKGSQQSSYNMHSNTPISDLELGYKDGNVFIGSTNNQFSFGGNSSLSNLLNGLNQNGNSLDSLLTENQFSFSFGSDDIRKLLSESSFDFDQMQEQFFNQFFGPGNSPLGKQSFSIPNISKKQGSGIPKYSFFNSKNVNKLIVIDGKESDFKTLDALAKADKLIEVDNLKPSTAISIYGNKAKDGAIIATTK